MTDRMHLQQPKRKTTTR